MAKTSKNAPSPKTAKTGNDLSGILDNFFAKKEKLLLYLGLGLATLFSILLFDVKVGPGGDDSAYIMRAFDFVHQFSYPGYQGALYPLVLSPFVAIFGINLPILKIVSLISMLLSLYFYFKAFVGKVPYSVLGFSFILLSYNYFLLFFASQTYSEAFFMMLQALVFWFLSKNFIDIEAFPSIKKFVILGLLLFLLTLTKNLAYAGLMVIIGYFLIQKQWKTSLYTVGSFLCFFIPWEILKRLVWSSKGMQFAAQGNGLMYKDFYNPQKGKEDLGGFVTRFFENSDLYFSKHLMKFFGFGMDNYDVNKLITWSVWILLVLAVIVVFRKNKLLMLAGFYTMALSGITFVALQTQWDQWRLIIIVFPFIILLLFSLLYYVTKDRFKATQVATPLVAVILLFSTLPVTMNNVKVQKEILAHNIKGETLYGLTPDQENYILMSKWAAANTPKDCFVAVRKADISFIYGERKFFGITKIPSITIDSLSKMMPDDGSVYVGISVYKIGQTQLFGEKAFRDKTLAFVNGKYAFGSNEVVDGNPVGIYKFSKAEFAEWEPKIKQAVDFYDPNIKPWVKNVPSSTTEYAVYLPDMLLDILKKNNVRYMMLASLRLNPAENSGNIITTVHRFMFFIQAKYPEIFHNVHQIGSEEPAELVQLTY